MSHVMINHAKRLNHTLNTGFLFENGDSILELLRWIFHYEIKVQVVIKWK